MVVLVLRSGDERTSAPAPRDRRVTPATVAAIVGCGAGAMLLGACGGGDGPPTATSTTARPAPLTSPVGHVFRAVSVERGGRRLRLFDEGRVLLEVDRDGLGTTAGCNAISATLRVTRRRFHVTRGFETAVGCPPPESQQEGLLASFFFGPDPSWRLGGDDRLVLARGRTRITWVRDDLPPALPTADPAQPKDLVAATFGTPEFKTWPWGLGGWGDPNVKVDVSEDDGRATLTLQESCRQLRASMTIGRTTLTVDPPRLESAPCRRPRRPYHLDDLRRFFGGEVMWHLDRRGLTLQRGRATLTLPVR